MTKQLRVSSPPPQVKHCERKRSVRRHTQNCTLTATQLQEMRDARCAQRLAFAEFTELLVNQSPTRVHFTSDAMIRTQESDQPSLPGDIRNMCLTRASHKMKRTATDRRFVNRSAGRGHPRGPRPRRTCGNVQHSDDLDTMNFAIEENPLTVDELIFFRAYSGEPRRRLLNFSVLGRHVSSDSSRTRGMERQPPSSVSSMRMEKKDQRCSISTNLPSLCRINRSSSHLEVYQRQFYVSLDIWHKEQSLLSPLRELSSNIFVCQPMMKIFVEHL